MKEEGHNFIYGNEEFGITGCINNGISEDVAQEIWNQMADFAKYAFNKSHAACYAAIAMQTAYLKYHYPIEFFAGLLSSVMDKTDKLVPYIIECKKKGIVIKHPDINESVSNFSVIDDNTLSYGLLSIKGLGIDVLQNIVSERNEHGNYRGLTDFIERTSLGKKVLEPLIKVGAFDFTGYTRSTMLSVYPDVLALHKRSKSGNVDGQMDLFALMSSDDLLTVSKDDFMNISEMPYKELLQNEKLCSGLYISGNPLDEYLDIISNLDYNSSNFVVNSYGMSDTLKDNVSVLVAGIVKDVRKTYTKNKDAMAFVTLEDQIGELRVTVFPEAYETYKDILVEDDILMVRGKSNFDSIFGASLLANKIYRIDDIEKNVWLRFKTYEDYKKFQPIITAYHLSQPSHRDSVYYYCTEKKETYYSKHYITWDEDAKKYFSSILDAADITVTFPIKSI